MARYGVFDWEHIDEPLEPLDWHADGYFDPESHTPKEHEKADKQKAEKE